MSVNVLPFWLCTFPVSCYAIGLYWCIRLEGDCSAILLTWLCMWDFSLLHSIYNPVMYMMSSSEFRRALFHFAREVEEKISHSGGPRELI
jgi:5-hydroxytryptamine receptor 1